MNEVFEFVLTESILGNLDMLVRRGNDEGETVKWTRIEFANLGPYDVDLVAMIRDVADAEVARVKGEGASWRIALERVSVSDANYYVIQGIAADALEPDSAAAAAVSDEERIAAWRSEVDRVSLTRAGEDCEALRSVVENLVAWADNFVGPMNSSATFSLRGILDDARAALEAK